MALPSSSVTASGTAQAALVSDSTDRAGQPEFHSHQTIHIARFDHSDRAWRALVRDMLALANSGGGQVYLDSAVEEKDVHDHLARHTDSAFADVRVLAPSQAAGSACVIAVGPALFPLGFAPPPRGGEEVGAPPEHDMVAGFYFRHGERTELGTTADMRSFVQRLLRRVRRRWLRGIRRVLTQPMTLDVTTTKRRRPERIRLERAVLQPVRIVSDPNAPALQPQDVDRLYPWRQKDLLRELNARLGRRALNSYDIQAVRRHHRLDERLEFVFNLSGAGRRYSPAVADWILEQYERHPEFFKDARAADQEMLKLRRKKPR